MTRGSLRLEVAVLYGVECSMGIVDSKLRVSMEQSESLAHHRRIVGASVSGWPGAVTVIVPLIVSGRLVTQHRVCTYSLASLAAPLK